MESEEKRRVENLRMDGRWFHSQRKVLGGRVVLEGEVDGKDV